jgi:putative ABC transport system permease protein
VLLIRASRRYLLDHPWQLGLALLGVALGVAVVVAVDLANQSAGRAFERSSAALSGRTTHQVLAGPSGLSEAWYVALRTEAGLRQAAPVVEGEARVVHAPEQALRVVGVDVFAEAGLRPTFGALSAAEGLGAWLARPNRAALLESDLARLGIAVGEALVLHVGGRTQELTVHAALRPASALEAEGLRDVVLVDIATAQELFGRLGRLDRVDLTLADPQAVAQVRARLPADAQLVETEARNAALQEMTRAFQLNLTAFSLLALVVGAFLIHNTMAFAVVQRRPLLARLRALGVSRGELFRVILLEALVIGALGTALGLLLGVALSRVLLALVGRTINDLYFLLSVGEVALAPLSIVKGLLLGLLVTAVAALMPAREATTVSARAALDRASLEVGVRRRQPWVAAFGVALIVVGLALVRLSGELLAAFAGVFCIMLGWAAMVPLLLALAATALAPLLGRLAGGLGRMAARGVSAGLSRTGVAASALCVAVSAVIGVGVMVESFRHTFSLWLDATLQADVYVSVAGGGSLGAAQVAALRAAPGVLASSSARAVNVPVDGAQARLRVFDLDADAARSFRLLAGHHRDAWGAFRAGEGVFVTEPWGWHRGVGVGDTLALATAAGERRLRVLAVVQDYSSSAGAVVMHRSLYAQLWDDPVIDSVGLVFAPEVDVRARIEQLRAVLAADPPLRFLSSRDIRRLSLEVFEQTFTITQVLRLLAMLVAVVGVLSALLALALERARELAVLRALGLLPGELWALVTLQNTLIGALAGLLAVPLGLVLAAVLTLVINQRAFGWTMELTLPLPVLAQAWLLAVLASLLAGLYPGWRMARAAPAQVLREESA